MSQAAPQTANEPADPPPDAAVRLENVRKVYSRSDGDVHAVDGVSLTFAPGSATAVTGPSGSGKSTLLSLIGGLDRPSDGSVVVLDTPLDDLADDALADLRRRHIGFVFQNYHLIPTLTVCENVMLPLAPLCGMSLQARGRALQCIERVGLETRINHLPKELSGGEQQRVALARALVNRPTIILADEPTGNLDPDAAGTVLGLLLELARGEGATIIITSHSREIAARCQRQIRIEAGKVVAG